MAAAAGGGGNTAAGGRIPGLPSDGEVRRRCLKVFRHHDLSGEGILSLNELSQVLDKAGVQLSAREFRRVVAEVDTDGNQKVNFEELVELFKKVLVSQAKFKNKNARIARQYMNPETYDKWIDVFRQRAGDDGLMNAHELDSFLRERRVTMPPDKLATIIQEVDTDGSGFLDESEFLSLLIKASGMKKRKVGPGACSLAMLVDEGWSAQELRKVGYEARDFIEESQHSVGELLDIFSVSELRRAGKQLEELLAAGWDAMDARQSGFGMAELLRAGCSIRKLRVAGWDDPLSAAELRKLGIDAGRLRLAGWALSELRASGFSTGELRAAGFSGDAIAALQRMHAAPGSQDASALGGGGRQRLQRRTTPRLLEEVEQKLAAREGKAGGSNLAPTKIVSMEQCEGGPSVSASGAG